MDQGPERWYLGAVSLNNSGVALVERGRYLQALTVLQDSMFAMRVVTTAPPQRRRGAPASNESGNGPADSAGAKSRQQLGLDGMLQRASRLVRDSASTGRGGSSFRLESEVLDVDVPHLAVMRDSSATAGPALTLLRIDATRGPDFEECDGAGPVLESIAVLHNFAVPRSARSAGAR